MNVTKAGKHLKKRDRVAESGAIKKQRDKTAGALINVATACSKVTASSLELATPKKR